LLQGWNAAAADESNSSRKIGTEMRKATRVRRVKSLVRAAELSMAAPQVVALRTAQMLAAGRRPSTIDQREFVRMNVEKVQAFWESSVAMSLQTMRANQEMAWLSARQWWAFWSTPWRFVGLGPRMFLPFGSAAFGRTMRHSMLKVLDQGMIPVHRMAIANARRLGHARRR
jgi:hypothetical protein